MGNYIGTMFGVALLAAGCGSVAAQVDSDGGPGGRLGLMSGSAGAGGGMATADAGTGGAQALGGAAGMAGAGAGGHGTGGAGGAVTCGGSLAGTWNVDGSPISVSGMIDASSLGLSCPGSVAPFSASVTASGTWTGSEGGFDYYSDGTTTAGSQVISFVAKCLLGGQVTCTRLAQLLTDAGYASVSCSTSASGCDCSTTVFQAGGLGTVTTSPKTSGSYSLMSGFVSFDTGAKFAYCVSGTAMTWTTAGGQIGFRRAQ